MLLKYRFLLIISAAFSYAVPLSLSAAPAFPALSLAAGVGNTGGMAAWYQARQQQINSRRNDLNALLAQSNAGDANAQYELGLIYQSGCGAPQDMKLAQRWFKSPASAYKQMREKVNNLQNVL